MQASTTAQASGTLQQQKSRQVVYNSPQQQFSEQSKTNMVQVQLSGK